MKSAFIRLSFSLFFCLAAGPIRAAQLKWFTNLAQAQAQAATEKKPVLLYFHGSDWCPPCIEMQRQVFDSPQFITYARQALVLVDVDFPETAKQSEELKRANLALKTRFNIGNGLPSIVLLNESGDTVFQEAGYDGGGPAEVLTELERHAKPPLAAGGSFSFKDVNVAEFAKMVANKQNVILDVRTPREFEAGHIAGAMNLNVLSPDFEKRAELLDKSKTYLVHCATGVRSTRACKELSQLHFPKLFNLRGGFQAWVEAGEPVQR